MNQRGLKWIKQAELGVEVHLNRFINLLYKSKCLTMKYIQILNFVLVDILIRVCVPLCMAKLFTWCSYLFRALTRHPQLSTITTRTTATATRTNTPTAKVKWMQIEKELSRGNTNGARYEDPSMGQYVTQKSPCIVVSCLSMYLFTCLLVALLPVRFPLIIAAIRQTKASPYMGHRIWAYDLCVFWFLCPYVHHAQHINKAL